MTFWCGCGSSHGSAGHSHDRAGCRTVAGHAAIAEHRGNSVQDEITNAVVTAIRPAVAEAEYRRTLRKPPESLGAWEAYQRGAWHKSRLKPNDILQARKFFKRAIELDPAFAMPHTELADLIVLEVIYFASIHVMRPRTLS
jgi:hypothetical protein